MIEYLYNAIRANAGQPIVIGAEISNEEGVLLEEGCELHLFAQDRTTMITAVPGECIGDEWTFTIPAEVTKGLKGRYWYCIGYYDVSLCFKQPIYLI